MTEEQPSPPATEEVAQEPQQVAPPPERRWGRRLVVASGLLMVVLMGSCVGCVVVGSRASSEGSPFAAKTIVAVTQPWDADALTAVAAPELLQVAAPEQLRNFFRFCSRRLGPLVKPGAAQKGQWRVSLGTGGFVVYSWQFSDCEFEHGPGRITMQVAKRSGEWRVLTFNVNSDLLIQDEGH